MPLIDPALTGLSSSSGSSGTNAAIGNSDSGSKVDGTTDKGKANGAARDGSISSASGSTSTSTPLSPFPLASLFSPSLFGGLSLPASGGVDTGMGSTGLGLGVDGTNKGASPTTAAGLANLAGAGFNLDLASPAGVYNALNSLNVFNAANGDSVAGGMGSGGASAGGLGDFMNAFGNDQNQSQAQAQGQGGTSPFNAFNNNGNLFNPLQANQFGFNDQQMSLLEQMAMYQIPQVQAQAQALGRFNNPNPERPIMRIDHERVVQRQGRQELAYDARF